MNMSFKIIAKIITAAAFIMIFLSPKIEAQYFGRNKVMYDDFNFKVLQTKHFKILYYPEEKDAVKYAAEMAERWYERHSEILDDTLKGSQLMIMYDGFPQFAETNVTQEMIGQGTGGFTEPTERRIVLPFAGPLSETDHVIGHELVHAFQFDITSKNNLSKQGMPAAAQMPLWFIEGMAEYLSIGPNDPNTTMWMREASLKKLPDISDLENPKYFPYRFGQSLLAFIGGKYGNNKIGELLRTWAFVGNEKKAIEKVFGISPDSLSNQWHAAIHAQYDSLAKITSKPEKYGNVLISSKNGGDMNISPVLSPDGKHLIFFSSKDLFSIDLFLADAKTGKIERNVFKTEFNTHLENLEFISSAGAWDSTGKKFVFAAVEEGRPVLTILNVDDESIKQVIRFPKLAEIFNPSWSPDGRYIVFSALANGLSNLFVYDLKTQSSRQLTDDAYAELQPTWSPDGKEILYSTDRFTTRLSDLDYGNYQLAIMNFETGKIERLPGFSDAKEINPQWSADGKSIYFISDHNGIDNLYRLDRTDNKIYQITNLFGGVSGITALSPALSVATNANELVYSVFQDNKYEIYKIDSTQILNGKDVQPEFAIGNPGVLPPTPQVNNTFIANLNNPYLGLPSDTTDYKTTDYTPSLRLVGVGQPSLAAGVDEFGTYVGGGVALFWSDMLGNYNLATALQISSGNGFTNISGLVGYMNTAHRLNWGGAIQQIPYYLMGYAAGYDSVNGQLAYVQQQYLYKETDREATGILAYPFSDVFRVEFSLGYTNISFTNQVTTQAVSLNDGSVLVNQTDNLPVPAALNLGTISTALVFDNSYYGATSPLLGSRYRLEVSPVIGNLDWINVLADYRQYIMPVRPFTIALRALHFGRYGKSADDQRLTPEYLGYPGLVRGYDFNSYNSGEAYDYLLGSKMLIGNAELRFPLLGAFGIGPGFYGYFPVEFGVFYDAGVAWSNDQKPSFMGGNRKAVTSYGLALRANLFGYAVGEVDFVHPNNHPGTSWLWEFNLTEGF
ncbi:MAG: peptidase S9 [Bacteroidetes bacterium]|nr:peptidase S9 [Bacteroidota bacterium]